jgi:hypothetical protein
MNSAWCDRASLSTLLDHHTRPGKVRSRRDGIGTRSTRLGNCWSIGRLPGCRPVETTNVPGGYRLASSLIQRAIPPPIGGKSYVSRS